MRYSRVSIVSIGYELPPNVITSAALEDRLAPVYETLRLSFGQLETMTGIRERRLWDPGFRMSDGAVAAGRKALDASGLKRDDIGLLIYGGVCRDNLEPATACPVADGLGLPGSPVTYDVSNACLGVVNGMVQIANAIELGQIAAGMVVSCESAREIIDSSIERLLARCDMETFKTTFATLTGGSGSIAVVLADASLAPDGHRLLGGAARSATEHHRLCRWGPDTGIPPSAAHVMETHAIDVLENGVKLGAQTWRDFIRELGWPDGVDKVICHQVGTTNRTAILKTLNIPLERDFSTFPYLANIGTVSLPITAAIAEQRGFLERGDKVGFLGIGSGLNCVMLGVQW